MTELATVKFSTIPAAKISELAKLREESQDAAKAYSDAVDEQAKQYSLKKGALKRYVNAYCDDKLSLLEAEVGCLSMMLKN